MSPKFIGNNTEVSVGPKRTYKKGTWLTEYEATEVAAMHKIAEVALHGTTKNGQQGVRQCRS